MSRFFRLCTLNLVALHWLGGNTFQAEVHEVFRPIELPDLFLECFPLPNSRSEDDYHSDGGRVRGPVSGSYER